MAKFKPAKVKVHRFILVVLAMAFLFTAVTLNSQKATAAQLLSRSLNISTAVAGASANYTFTFTTQTSASAQTMTFQACTTPLGTCTTPSSFSWLGATFASQNNWQGATNFAIDSSGANGCTATANNLCLRRVDATSQTNTSRDITINGVTNPNSSNYSFYVRINIFSDAGYTTGTDYGTVASSTAQTLTANAAVQEVLNFCVGSTLINDATTAVSANSPDYCNGISGTSVDLGTLDSGNVSVSPVSGVSNGNSRNGVVMIDTNATNGASINYDAIQQSGTNHKGTLRVVGASCNAGNVSTDPCIDAVGGTKSTLTPGTEKFGMSIAGVNCGIASNFYTCNFGAGTYNLSRTTNYNNTGGNTYGTDNGQVNATTAGQYAWDESGNPVTVATSSTIIGYEALIVKFAATAALTTPTGSYSAQTDFIAVPTY